MTRIHIPGNPDERPDSEPFASEEQITFEEVKEMTKSTAKANRRLVRYLRIPASPRPGDRGRHRRG